MKRIILLLILMLTIFSSSNAQYWKELRSIPPAYINNYWLDVYFHPSNSNYGWVCGFQGMIIRTTDGGNSWSGSQIAGVNHLEHVNFPSLTVGYTSGPDGIYKSTNGGQSWVDVTPNNFISYWGCYFVDENVGLVLAEGCNDQQRFYRTSDGGQTWTLFTGTEPASGLTDLILYDANGLGFAASSGRIWRTLDGGSTWSVFASSGTKVWNEELTHKNSSFLVPYAGVSCSGQGGDGGMRFTSDLGNTWMIYQTGVSMFGAYLVSDIKGWVCGDNKSVYYTSDAGNSWNNMNCGIRDDADLDDMWFVNENLGYVVGNGVYRFNQAENSISKDTLFFRNLCKNTSKTDSLIVSALNFTNTNVEISIVNDVGNHFRIISPAPSFILNSCDNRKVIVGFFPKDELSHTARLRVIFNPGLINEYVKYVELIGSVNKPTAFPQDTLIVVNNVVCNTSRQISIPWFVEGKGEFVEKVDNLNNSGGISISFALPTDFLPPVTNTNFVIQLADTGWFQSRFKFRLQPCDRDTFITIRAYGVSPIINHSAKLQINSSCLEPVYDTLRISNTGNDILKIGQIKLDPFIPEFTIIGWLGKSQPITINPNEIAELVILYNPRNHGTHLTRLSIENNDSTKVLGNKNPYLIELRGVSVNVDLTDTLLIDLGDVCFGTQKTSSGRIINSGNLDATLTISNSFDNLKLTLSDINSKIRKNDSLNINIIFDAVTKGIFRGESLISSSPCGSSTVIIVLANVIYNELEISPQRLSGIVKLGESIDKTVNVKSLSNIDINIRKISIEPVNPDWQITFLPPVPILLLPSQGVDFKFNFKPLSSSKLDGRIVIETDGDCSETYYVDLDISSFSRFVEISPDKIDFGKFLCDYDEQIADIKISNLGFESDTITDINFSPVSTVFELLNPPSLPLIIDANNDYVLKIKFKKQTNEGLFSSNLVIKTIGDDGQKFEIPINAEFYKSDIQPSYHKMEFGNFEICTNPSILSVEVRNNGTLADTLVLISNTNEPFYKVINRQIVLTASETKSIDIEFNPLLASSLGVLVSKIIFESTVCKQIVEIDASATIIEPVLNISPQNIEFGDKWSEEVLSKTIIISNTGIIPVRIDGILLSENIDFNLDKNPVGNTIMPSNSLSFDLKYISSIAGSHSTEINIIYSTDCIDSIITSARGSVKPEEYQTKVFIDKYEAAAGQKLEIYLKLTNGFERIESDNIDFEISFDKNLFYPSMVETRFGNGFSELPFTYGEGKIQGSIQNEFARDLMKVGGNLLKISGTVLLSLPDTTTLTINKFDVVTDKSVIINKEHGFLKLIDYCERPTELSKLIMMPRFKINSGNVAKNGFYNFDINSTSDVDVELQITDINGITQDLAVIKSNAEKTEHNIDLQNFSNGVYFVYFKSKYQKLMVQIINIK